MESSTVSGGPDAETDVLIVGGGVTGLTLALESSRLGLSTAVIEGDDFGAGATLNSLRVVHGGLRYLQTLNLSRARRSIRARRELMRIAPGIINPIECRIPMTKWGVRSRLPITAAWVFSDILGWDRNVGLCAEQRLPPNRFWANKTMRPEGSGVSVVPAAGWWDAIVMRPHRLMAELVQRNVSQGVRVTNHARVKELLVDGNTVCGVKYTCADSSESRTLRSKMVIDAAGHGGRIFRNRCDALYPLCDWVGAANFLLDEQTSATWASAYRARERLGFGGPDNVGSLRDFFFVPTPDGMLAGTTYVALDRVQDQLVAAKKAFDQLIDECNRARPENSFGADDVRHMFWGLLPVDRGSSGAVSNRLLEHDLLVDGKTEFGLSGYHRVQAVKLTTATELARETMKMVQRHWRDLDAPNPPGTLVSTKRVDNSDELRCLFAENSSTQINEVISRMEIGQLRDLIRHCVRKEFAASLEDLLQRRIGLLPVNYPDNCVRDRLARLMGEELAWTQNRVSEELDHATKAVEAAPAALIAN